MTPKQPRKIFPILPDIYHYYPQPIHYLTYIFQKHLHFFNPYQPISLTNSKTPHPTQLIHFILHFLFHNNIPITIATSNLITNHT
ncbi:putative HNHc nuclease, partial [Staphylococcus saprophyticus]|uniref:putative HNHc nuclease n=1 Tax=Staphylococcus saprophyticus TaxID=29385 RepID=UPI003703B634